MIGLEQYVLFLLSLKKAGKSVDFKHIEEKAARDMRSGPEAVQEALESLIERGDVLRKGDGFMASEQGRARFAAEFESLEEEISRVNPAWVLVYTAKNYYTEVADEIVSLCRDRYVGFFCVFTDKHFFRRKLGSKYIQVSSTSDLMRLVDMHYVDAIPCVHRIGADRPDWLVVDLDAGGLVPFKRVKEAALLVHEVLSQHEVHPALKFSGSRGFQIWVNLAPFDLPRGYRPLRSSTGETRKRSYFSLLADTIAFVESRISGPMGGITTSTIADKGGRERKILLDSSSMKEMGLVRAPYSIHHSSGLVSMPLDPGEVERFEPSQAKPARVLQRFRERGNEFPLPESDPSALLRATLEWMEGYNTGT